MRMHEKVRALHDKIKQAADELGVTIIVERMYIVDRETGNVTTMEIMQHEGASR